MKTNETLLGVQSPGDELEIRDLQRIRHDEEIHTGLFDGTAGPVVSGCRKVLFNAWSGETGAGLPVHVAYRIGELTIEVDLPTPVGGYSPLTVLRWKPRLALALVAPGAGSLRTGTNAAREEQARLIEVSHELAEIRAQNREPQMIGGGELRYWLAERNRHFGALSAGGLAGGQLRFRFAEPQRKEATAA